MARRAPGVPGRAGRTVTTSGVFANLRLRAAALGAAAALLGAHPARGEEPAAAPGEVVRVAGLRAPVEILVDRWGVPHICARNRDDLFFAQGWNAARDRLVARDRAMSPDSGALWSAAVGTELMAAVGLSEAARTAVGRPDMELVLRGLEAPRQPGPGRRGAGCGAARRLAPRRRAGARAAER